MGNFAQWPRWIHICLAIIALAVAVAGLREYPDLKKLLIDPEGNVSAKNSTDPTDVRIITENEDDTPIKGVTVRFLTRDGSPLDQRTTDDGYADIKIPNGKDVKITLIKPGYKTQTHIINLKNEPSDGWTYHLKKN